MWCISHNSRIPDLYFGGNINKMYDEKNHKEFERLFLNTLFIVVMLFNEKRKSKESNNNGNQGSEGLIQDSENENNPQQTTEPSAKPKLTKSS